MANINNIIQVNSTIDTGGLLRRQFGIGLFVTTDDTLKSSDRLRTYADFADIQADFAVASAPYIAGDVWFAQSPFPKNVMVGRWFNVDSAASLISGTLPALATITAVANGTITINALDATAIDFTSDLSYADAANTLQVALVGAGVPCTVTFDSITTSFTIETTATGSAATLTYASVEGTGTDLSSLLLLDSATAAQLNQGVDAETIEQAMKEFQSIDNSWYFITLDPLYNDTQAVVDLSVWTNDFIYMYFAESNDAGAVITDESSSIFAQLFAAQSDRTAGDWLLPTVENAAVYDTDLSTSSTARLSSVDFDGTDTVINQNLKDRPLINVTTLTTSQTTELERKRVNRFTAIGGGTTSPTIENKYFKGFTFKDGIWQDVRYGVDWFDNAVQISVLDLLIELPVLPQTVSGQTQVKKVVEDVCVQGINNGLIAPGIVSDATKSQIISVTGNSKFDGTLTLGYMVFNTPISSLTEQERIDRKLPPIYVWTTGSSAVNFIEINAVFSQ